MTTSDKPAPLDAESARGLLLGSRRWQNLTKGLDLMSVAKADPIDLEDLSLDESEELRGWVSYRHVSVPKRIADYLARIGT